MTKPTCPARPVPASDPAQVTARDVLNFAAALANLVAAIAKHAAWLGKAWKWIENWLP